MESIRALEGQVAVVTGGASGIGKGIVEAMAAAGAAVVINYLSEEDAARQIVEGIRQRGGRAVCVGADVGREEEVQELFAAACREFGTVDILVNNAGIQQDAPFLEMSLDQWNKVFGVNLTGAFLCAREAARIFCRRGVDARRSRAAGKILFISSVHEAIPWAGRVNYAASKGGVEQLMKSLAQELAGDKIRVNSIGPGAIKTDINRSSWETPEAEEKLKRLIPYDRVGEVEDVAKAAVWLVSDEADYVTGITLFVDGGMLLYPGFHAG